MREPLTTNAPAALLARLRLGARLAAVVVREAGPLLSARLLPVWTAVGFGLVQFWTVIDWNAVGRAVAHLPALVRIAGACSIVLAGAATGGETVRAATQGRVGLRPWWRSGVGAVERGVGVAPVLAVVMAPAALTAAFWPGGPVANVLLRLVVAGPLTLVGGALLRAPGGRRAALQAVGLLVATEGAQAALAGVPGGAWLSLGGLAGATSLAIPLAGRMHALGLGEVPAGTEGWLSRWWGRPRGGVLGALVWRDLLAIARTEPGQLALAALPVLPMSILAHGLALRAPELDRATTLAVMACSCAPLGGAWLGVVLPALGRQLDPPRWPVRVSTRAASLLVVALAPFLPTGTALAATAATGPGDVSSAASAITEMLLVAVVCAAGAAWIAAWPRPGRRRPFNVGAHLAWVLALLFLSLWRAPTARVVQVGLGVVAMCGATAALERGRRTLPTATALEGT